MRLGLILSLLFLISILPSKAVYAEDGSMTQGDSSYNKWVDHGLKDDHMGWLYYLVDPSTNEQKSTTEAVACNSYGIEYNLGSTRKGVEDIRLKSRFGVNYDAVTKGIPKWGKPYTRSGTAFNGRGDIVKRFLLSHETKVINGKKLRGKHAMAYGVIARAWNKELADKWENKELLLVFEPFFWNGVYADKLVNGTPSWKWEGKYICATALNMGKYQLEREKIGKIHSEGPWAIYDGSNGAYPHCVMLESGQTILGMSISKSQYAKRNSRITNAEMAIPTFGFGVGVVWTKKQDGIINTYDGSHSPGKPESTSKKKNTTGRSTIIKQYWDIQNKQIQRQIYTLENYLQKYYNLQTQCMSRLHRIFTVTEV